MIDFWQHCLQQLERELTPQQFTTWIRPLTPLGMLDDPPGVRVGAPNNFKLNWARSNYAARLEALAHEHFGQPMVVRFELVSAIKPATVGTAGGAGGARLAGVPTGAAQRSSSPHTMTDSEAYAPSGDSSDQPTDDIQTSLRGIPLPAPAAAAARRGAEPVPAISSDPVGIYERSRLNVDLTFETFVTGKANQLARAAAMQVAENPGTSYNPLFLYGGVGLGKTHLIHAVGNTLVARNAATRVRYIHAEQYVSDVVKAYQRKAFDEFKRYYHSLDLLLIDDIQFFSGKNRTQEEFFYAFEALVADRKQIIITSDTYPKELSGIDERLISRFDSGLTVAIEPPELEMRVAILIKKAELEGIDLAEEVAFFIAKHLRSNVRELEGALRKVLAYAKFHGRTITVELSRDALKDLLSVSNGQITVENIQKTVADYYKIKVADMYSKRRPANIALPRQIAMYLAKELTQKSLPEIGELFGGRDHTTVLHAVRKIAELRPKQAELNHALHVLEQTLKG